MVEREGGLNMVRVHIDGEVRELNMAGRCPECGADWSEDPPTPLVSQRYYHEPYAYTCPKCGAKWNRFLLSL